MGRNTNNNIVTFAEYASTTYQANNGIVRDGAAWVEDTDDLRKKGAIPGTGASSIQMNTAIQQASIGSAILCDAITDSDHPVTSVDNLTATPGTGSNTGWKKAGRDLYTRLEQGRQMYDGDKVVPKANFLTNAGGTNLIQAFNNYISPQGGTVSLGASNNKFADVFANTLNGVLKSGVIDIVGSDLYANGSWTALAYTSFFFTTHTDTSIRNLSIPAYSRGIWIGPSNGDMVIYWTDSSGVMHTKFWNNGAGYQVWYGDTAQAALYASADTSKGTIEERLTRLGFSPGNVTFSYPTRNVTTNYVNRQGNYVFGQIQCEFIQPLSEGEIFTIPEGFTPTNTIIFTTGVYRNPAQNVPAEEFTCTVHIYESGKVSFSNFSVDSPKFFSKILGLNFGYEAPPRT